MIRCHHLILIIGLLLLSWPAAATYAAPPPPVEANIQSFLDAQPGALKLYQDNQRNAAELIQSASAYYGISPRILLALLEATNSLLSNPTPPDSALRQPFGPNGPDGFTAQLDWATRELRAGLGPYDRAPIVRFTDGTTLTLALEQVPEGVSVQRFLAHDRDQASWRAVFARFNQAFQQYFNNELPEERQPQPVATNGFLHRPWQAGTRVVHLAYFDHMYPTVDTERPDNGFVVNYLGQSNVQYDGHDGNDFYFPDQPIGTYILAAADGIAHASTHRGNGVWIDHPDGYVTVYWHLDAFANMFLGKVNTGAGVAVHAGDLIGTSGKSGFVAGTPHLHFEVRHNNKEVDPYGWYGSGSDPCVAYTACESSVWLWHSELVGEFDFTPPNVTAPDHTPPNIALTINPRADLLFLARFDGNPLPQIGAGTTTVAGALGFNTAKFADGVRVAGNDRVAYPTAGNLELEAGTIAFWAQLPESYPNNSTGRHYLFASSAHADEGPLYTDTLALRREQTGPDGAAQWNFWTTTETSEAGRNDLTAPDRLKPGLHHFAISWDRARQAKMLYLDGALAIGVTGVDLPQQIGTTFDLGRWSQGTNASNVIFDDLAIFNRALSPLEVAQLASSSEPIVAGATHVTNPNIAINTNALDDGGAIMAVQFGINGAFDAPQPFANHYSLQLPDATDTYTVAARMFDRAGNNTTVSSTVTLLPEHSPTIKLESHSALSATLVFSPAANEIAMWVQISATPNFSTARWQLLPTSVDWAWPNNGPRAVWVRFRDEITGISTSQVIGPDQQHLYLPITRR